MKAFADGYVVTPGLIRGDTYSFFLESKVSLWVTEPRDVPPQRGVSIFFLGVALAAALGIWIDQRIFALVLPLLFVAGYAAFFLIRSFGAKSAREWQLFLGTADSPALIYSSPDAEAFEIKRSEIERVLLMRPEA